MSLFVSKSFQETCAEMMGKPVVESAAPGNQEVPKVKNAEGNTDEVSPEKLAEDVQNFVDNVLVPEITALLDEGFSEEEAYNVIMSTISEEEDTEEEQLDEMASATKKHFRAIADTVSSIEDEGVRKQQATKHAEHFAKANPRFDRKKFMDACGVKGE